MKRKDVSDMTDEERQKYADKYGVRICLTWIGGFLGAGICLKVMSVGSEREIGWLMDAGGYGLIIGIPIWIALYVYYSHMFDKYCYKGISRFPG